jgi:hypothetical protein
MAVQSSLKFAQASFHTMSCVRINSLISIQSPCRIDPRFPVVTSQALFGTLFKTMACSQSLDEPIPTQEAARHLGDAKLGSGGNSAEEVENAYDMFFEQLDFGSSSSPLGPSLWSSHLRGSGPLC